MGAGKNEGGGEEKLGPDPTPFTKNIKDSIVEGKTIRHLLSM